MLLLGLAKGRKDIFLALLVPLLGPLGWAEGEVRSLELLAWNKVLALGFRALEIIHIVLPAVLGLYFRGSEVTYSNEGDDTGCHGMRHGPSIDNMQQITDIPDSY